MKKSECQMTNAESSPNAEAPIPVKEKTVIEMTGVLGFGIHSPFVIHNLSF